MTSRIPARGKTWPTRFSWLSARYFLLSVLPKLRRPDKFQRIVAAYDVLPRSAAVAAPAVIAIEIFLAFAFVSGWLVEIALVVALLIIASFAFATTVNVRRARRINCGCFGSADEQISGRSLVRLGEMALAVAVLGVGMLTGAVAPTTFRGLPHKASRASPMWWPSWV